MLGNRSKYRLKKAARIIIIFFSSVLIVCAVFLGCVYIKQSGENSYSDYTARTALEYGIVLPQGRSDHRYWKESISIDSVSSEVYELDPEELDETKNNIKLNKYWHNYCSDDEVLIYSLTDEHRDYLRKYVDIENSVFAAIVNDDILYPAGDKLYLDLSGVDLFSDAEAASGFSGSAQLSGGEAIDFMTSFHLFVFDPVSEIFVIVVH